MAADYTKGLLRDYQNLILLLEKRSSEKKKLGLEINMLKNEVREQKEIISQKDEKIEKLELEVKRLKNNKSKDSTNSSIPTNKNSYTQVKNSRKKSDKKLGGQEGHEGFTLDVDKIQELISSGRVNLEIIEINKCENNQNSPRIRYVQDIQIRNIIKKYIYYPDESGNYKIPSSQNNLVTYGETIKSIGMLLVHKLPASMDQVKYFFNIVTNNSVNLTKSTIVNWTNTFANSLEGLIEEIREGLLNSQIVNTDESPINIDGKTYQLHNYSNKDFTLQYTNKKRTKEAIAEIDFLPKFFGTLIHDHNTVQYNYGSKHGECNAHILRYLQAVSDFTVHKWSEQMIKFLQEVLHQRNLLTDSGEDSFDEIKLKSYSDEYDKIIKSASKEYQTDYNKNAYKDDERRLITRLENYKQNHLLFMYDFNVPFTNNVAESDIRPTKRKLNTGIFRSESGAESYLRIRSFISTFQKRGLDIFDGILECFKKGNLTLTK